MAAADATLSESTPPLIGMRTLRSAWSCQRAESPSPSVPSSRASRPPPAAPSATASPIGPAVHPVAGELAGDLWRDHVHRAGAAAGQVLEAGQPVAGDQQGADRVARGDGAPDHQLTLGDEQLVRRFEALAQADVGQAYVVRKARVVGIADRNQAAHPTSLAEPARSHTPHDFLDSLRAAWVADPGRQPGADRHAAGGAPARRLTGSPAAAALLGPPGA